MQLPSLSCRMPGRRIMALVWFSGLALLSGCRSSGDKTTSHVPVERNRPIRSGPAELTSSGLSSTASARSDYATSSAPEELRLYTGISDEELARFYELPKIPAPPSASLQAPDKPQTSDSLAVGQGWDVRLTQKWSYIVIHHSAGQRGSAAIFHRQHVQENGWDGLGYHFVIGNGTDSGDGEVEVGYRWTQQKRGAHAGNNDYNIHGIGICLVGNFEIDQPTPRQMSSLYALVRYLQQRAGISTANVIGHKDVPNKDTICPGRHFNLSAFKSQLDSGGPASYAQPRTARFRHRAPAHASAANAHGAGFP